jgi:SAM-dependent methyltransferase
MAELSRYNPTGRFAGLAGTYARFRPTYPESAIAFIVARCNLHGGSELVEIGCGTGISSRIFTARGVAVLGLEPNAEMRTAAENEPFPPDLPKPIYREGRAEATGLPPCSADAVVAAQAFHWFEPEPALREFHRILRPGGWVVLMWNERDECDPFTAAYGAVIRTGPDTALVEVSRARGGEPLLVSPLFESGERVVFKNQQNLTYEGLLGRAFSCSYAPKDPDQVEAWTRSLREVFDEYQVEGKVVLQYETSVYLARRPT